MRAVLFIIGLIFVGLGESYTIRKNESSLNRETIIGGVRASILDAPHHVQLYYNGEHRCGGSLITAKHVITAAHCLISPINYKYPVTVYAGSNSMASLREKRKAKYLFKAAGFSITENVDGLDFGMIVLEKPFILSKTIRPIKLPTRPTLSGEKVTVFGFGYISYDRESDYLMKLTSYTVDCSKYDLTSDIKQDICMLPSAKSSPWNGDSGSGLINSRGELVGIVSGAATLTVNDASPAIFAPVYKYLREIKVFVEKTSKFF